jgi:hypothetical protein
MARWRKEKAQRRLKQPKAFSTKGSASLTAYALREEAVFKHSYRGGGGAQHAFTRLKHYVDQAKPHHRILYQMFFPAIRRASQEINDPKLLAELLLDRYAVQDPLLAAFKFDVVSLGHSEDHDIWMFFRGRECFLVFRRGTTVRRSEMYMNTEFLKNLPISKVQWAGEPVKIPVSST